MRGFEVHRANSRRQASPMPAVAPANTATSPAGRDVLRAAFEVWTTDRETIVGGTDAVRKCARGNALRSETGELAGAHATASFYLLSFRRRAGLFGRTRAGPEALPTSSCNLGTR